MEGILEKTLEAIKAIAMPIDDLGERMIKYHVKVYGLEWVINDLLKDLDCTRLYNGRRLTQTIDTTYKYNLGEMLYIITNYNDVETVGLEEKLCELHNKNLEYEVENPPIIYQNKPKSNNAEKRKKWEARQTQMFEDVPPKRKTKQFTNLKIVIK